VRGCGLSSGTAPTKFISIGAFLGPEKAGQAKGWHTMDKELYKCFECGKFYEDEQAAIKCHNAPIQKILKKDTTKKPKFLGA
jgi:DNA-directed RNA polymerase subunit RPC12/RpoP